MKYFILGTAGHVDHGKTELVKALTGIDTDRLPEEKRRGLTIDLGFAHLKLPSARVAGIVDVPGHERFLKNMLAGVGGYDLALLVVDAREGIKPQTIEHLEILNLLEVVGGVVAITKADLASKEDIEALKEELASLLKDTFLKDAPIIPVSSIKKTGIDKLIDAIERMAEKIPPREKSDGFRLPVDRVFLKEGFGVVVTGTLIVGKICKGDNVYISPSGKNAISTRVRRIQVYGEDSQQAEAGQRVALNLAGVEASQIHRGQVLVSQRSGSSSRIVEVSLTLLPDTGNLSSGYRVRFYSLTFEVMGKMYIGKKESDKARIILEKEVSIQVGDHFIIRSSNALKTLGGGRITGIIHEIKDGIRKEDREKTKTNILFYIAEYNNKNPWRWGIRFPELRSKFSEIRADLIELCIDELKSEGKIKEGEGKIYSIYDFKPALDSSRESVRERLISIMEKAAFQSPSIESLEEKFASKQERRFLYEVLEYMKDKGEIVEISNGIFFLNFLLDEAKRRLSEFYRSHGSFTPAQCRDILSSTRKYIIPLLEYLDKTGFTTRKDDARVLNYENGA